MKKIKKFLIDNKLIFAAFFMPVLIMVLAFAVTGIFPFGDSQIAVIDMYHQYVPFLSELQYKLQEGGNLFYSWQGAGGSNFWNLMAYYGASPINLLLVLFPKAYIMEAVTIVLLIKIGLAGSFMAIYLRYVGKKCNMVTVAFATLYALSSYVLAYYWCIMWMDAVAFLPLCILGLNKIIDGKSAVLYVLSLGYVVFANYYIAIMVCIFILFYYPVLYFIKIRDRGAKHCAAVTGKAIGYSFLSIGVAAVMLLPTYISMQSTYYISSKMPENWLFYNDVLDVINQLMPNTELTFREGLPNLYCGTVVVILLILYFTHRGINLREKLLNGGFLLFMFFSLNVNKLDFIWHGFHFPNQLPFRYTFVICFVLIGLAYSMYQKIEEVESKKIWYVLFGIIGYLIVAQKLMAEQEYGMQLFFYSSAAWVALYCSVILLSKKEVVTKASFTLLIVVLVAAEMVSNTCGSLDKIGNSYREAYFANYKDITKLIDSVDDEFSRMEMDNLYTLNNPAMYHYKGISQFSSSINSDTTYFMEKIGLDGSPGRNRFNYNKTNPVINSMLNIKYIVAKNLKMKDKDFIQVDKSGHSRLYESKYPLSIGYMTGNEIRTWSVESDNPFDVLDDYVRAATANQYTKVFEPVGNPVIEAKNASSKQIADGKYSVKGVTKDTKGKVTLEYTSPKTQKYYVFVEAANAEYITASNGNKLEDIEIRNDCGSIVNIGTIKKGETFKIIIDFDKGKSADITCHVRSLNQADWDGAYDIISSNTMRVTEYGDNYLKGEVDVKTQGVLVTSIPYDKGWKLKVDGNKKEISELTGGVFISTALDEGKHTIELKFTPPGIIAGAAISVLSIILLVLIEVIRRRKQGLLESLSACSEVEANCQEELDCNKIRTNCSQEQ